MMKQMEKDGVAFDEFTYSSAIVACGKGGKPKKALKLLDEMVNVYGESSLLTKYLEKYFVDFSFCLNRRCQFFPFKLPTKQVLKAHLLCSKF